MVRFTYLTSALAATSLLGSAIAHPGEKHDANHLKREIAARNALAKASKRALNNCAGSLKHRQLMQRSHERRSATLQQLRQKRGISTKSKKLRRDLATLQEFEAINHNLTGTVDYTTDTDAATIFSGNTSCILAPEVTDGPYYVIGELIRQNVKEDEHSDGVDMYLEIQYIDVDTCEPVEGLYIDIWNANATGVYSGIVATGNSAADGFNSTYLRGIQPTDSDGVAAFETIFPGHYDGRATHTHLLTHSGVTLNDNNTISGGAVTHIGQLFFPEDLISAVEAVAPYNTNTLSVTTNDEDMWSIVQAEDDFDPFPEFVYLGDDVEDGLLAWIQIGINTTADYTDDDYYSVAAYIDENGGHSLGNSVSGGGGNGTGNGTAPSGAIPTGAIPSDVSSVAAASSEVVGSSTVSEDASEIMAAEGVETGLPQGGVSSGTLQEGSPSGSPQGGAPSGSPQGGAPSGSPQGGSPSGSPQSGIPSGAPQSGTPNGNGPAGPSGTPGAAKVAKPSGRYVQHPQTPN